MNKNKHKIESNKVTPARSSLIPNQTTTVLFLGSNETKGANDLQRNNKLHTIITMKIKTEDFQLSSSSSLKDKSFCKP